jgi:predicted dehydrogenase
MARRFDEAESVLRFLGVSVPNSQDVLTRPLNGIHHRVLVGYTLRHHPAIIHAKKLVTEGFIGEPMYVRGRYGHGGRSGYEREWRGSVELSGGGELLDQGVHLIDLSRWFLGEFRQVTGVLGDYFWAQKEVQNVHSIPVEDFKSNSESEYIKHPAVEDNAFMLLRTQTEKIAFLHASWTQWKNMFSFEIFGREGFIAAEGLGGNYGPERLITGVRQAAGELPQIEEISFSQFPDSNGATSTQGKDRRRSRKTNSRGYCLALRSYWDTEWSEFVDAVQSTRSQRENTPNLRSASAFDAWQNLQIVDAIYRSAQQNIVVDLEPELPSTSTGAWDRQGTPRDLQLGGHLPRINSPRTCMPDGFVKPHQ